LSGDRHLQLVDFTAPAHWLWTEEQLRGEMEDGTGLRKRYRVANWLAKGKQAYGLIAPVVERRSIRDIVCDQALPAALTARAAEVGKGRNVLRRALNAYLFGLGNWRALLPWYSRCGSPGQERHSKLLTGCPSIGAKNGHQRPFGSVPPEIRKALQLGWRRFKKRGVSVKEALASTKGAYLAKSVQWEERRCKVEYIPEAQFITEQMFRYWGERAEGALTARQIERGETPARREYLRRMSKMKGRVLTVNQVAYLDSTSTDQTLVSAASSLKVLRAPWRTEVLGGCIDYIFGIYVGFEAPSAMTALLAILNAAASPAEKVAFCARYDHVIQPRDWYGSTFSTYEMDNGEGKGSLALMTLQELEATAKYGAVYDPINKAPGESGHRQRQRANDHLLPGSTMGLRKERGEPHRADFARLRFDDYMHELIKTILHHNNEAYIDPQRLEMYEGLKERTRRGVLEWLMAHHYVSSAAQDLDALRAACLPRFKASMHADGLHLFMPGSGHERLIPEMVYRSEWLLTGRYTERAHRKSWRLDAHLDPSDLRHVWVNLDGLKRLDLQTHDDQLQELCLFDWLTICADNRLAGYLAGVRASQAAANRAIERDDLVRRRSRDRAAELKALKKRPSKASLRGGVAANTAIEAAAMTGVPRVPPATPESVADGCTAPPHSPRPDAKGSLDVDGLIDQLEALYDQEQGHGHR
jgi:hypothetical protein